MKIAILFIMTTLCLSFSARAQEVGRAAAGKYFSKEAPRAPADISDQDHYLAIHAGQFIEATAWEWGQHERAEKTGSYTVGLTYRMRRIWEQMDLNLRVEFDEYNITNEKPFKLSVMPLITFPDASSKFPLYFGAGVGGGVFFRQVKDESYLSLDYQLIMGARFFDIYENAGFFVETGLRNLLLITTNGQFNSTFLCAGAVFTF